MKTYLTIRAIVLTWIIGSYIIYPVIVALANRGVRCLWEYETHSFEDFLSHWFFAPLTALIFTIVGSVLLVTAPVWLLVKGKEDRY